MALSDSGVPMCETRIADTGIAAANGRSRHRHFPAGTSFPALRGNSCRDHAACIAGPRIDQRNSVPSIHIQVQDDGKFAGDCDTGLAQAFAFCDAHAPGFESRSSGNSRQQHIRRFKQIASEHAVAALGDAACPVRFTRRVSPCGQSHIGSNTARFLKARRIIDGCKVTKRCDRANARRGRANARRGPGWVRLPVHLIRPAGTRRRTKKARRLPGRRRTHPEPRRFRRSLFERGRRRLAPRAARASMRPGFALFHIPGDKFHEAPNPLVFVSSRRGPATSSST